MHIAQSKVQHYSASLVFPLDMTTPRDILLPFYLELQRAGKSSSRTSRDKAKAGSEITTL